MNRQKESQNLLSKITGVILAVAVAAFILTASIAVALTFRGFYYSQVKSLGIEASTDYSYETITKAFDEMMDYCVGGGEAAGLEFGTGDLAWSEEGKAHFDDCAVLFRLDFTVFWISLAVIVILVLIRLLFRKKNHPKVPQSHGSMDVSATKTAVFSDTTEKTAASSASENRKRKYGFLGRGPLFWGPILLVVIFAILGVAAAVDFDAFFVAFHRVFFPGKENWIFDYQTDQIINILPETLFMHYAILILVCLLVLSLIFIVIDLLVKRKRHIG